MKRWQALKLWKKIALVIVWPSRQPQRQRVELYHYDRADR